jgi:hypothetical protein
MSIVSRRAFTGGLLASAFAPSHLAFGNTTNDLGRIAIIDTPNNAARFATQLAASNVRVVVRYFARKPQPGLREKVMASDGNIVDGVREPTILIRHGISILSLYQYKNNMPEKFLNGLEDTGSAKAEAEADAKAALEQAKLVGQPEGSAIYFGVDFNFSKCKCDMITGKAIRPGQNDAATKRDIVDAMLQYFRIMNQTIGGSYAIGIYGNGFVNRTLRDEKLVSYNWISASRSHEETSHFYNRGQWHLFQNQIDRRWFVTPGKCSSGLDVDMNVQNPHVSDIGAWGAGQCEPARTQAIFEQRRFVARATSVFRESGGKGGLIERVNCRPDGRIARNGNVRILAQANGWCSADIDEDGIADGFVANADLTTGLSSMPHWDSLT